MKVKLLTNDKNNAYDEFLGTQKAAMIYYSLKFRDFLKRQTKAEAICYIAIDHNENIQGILPLMIKSGPYGKVLNSLPFYGSNGGILANNEIAKNKLMDKYLEIANSGEYVASTLIENPLDKEYPYDRIIFDEKDFRIGQLTNIAGNFSDLEDLMIRFDSKTRNIIRKAMRSHVTVKIENDQLDFLRNTHLDNMVSIGGLAKDFSFFKNVFDCFQQGVDYDIYVARLNNIPVAATLVFYFGKVVEYYTPVIVKEYRSFQPLSLIISTAMLDSSAKGFEWWNWGGTWQSQGGVYDFKSKWGTIDIKYNYYVILYDKSLYEASKEDLLSNYSGFYVLPFDKLIN
jgi:hypothetical protein